MRTTKRTKRRKERGQRISINLILFSTIAMIIVAMISKANQI